MREAKFYFYNLPPMPRNRSHEIMKGKNIKTDLARAFENDVNARLEVTEFRNFFSGSDGMYYDLVVYTPKELYFNEDNNVSKTSVDFDAHKLFMDCVASFMGFNDGQIISHRYDKVPVDSDLWIFSVHLKEMKRINIWNEDTLISTLNSQKYQSLRSV